MQQQYIFLCNNNIEQYILKQYDATAVALNSTSSDAAVALNSTSSDAAVALNSTSSDAAALNNISFEAVHPLMENYTVNLPIWQ